MGPAAREPRLFPRRRLCSCAACTVHTAKADGTMLAGQQVVFFSVIACSACCNRHVPSNPWQLPANQSRQPRRGAAALEVWIGLTSPAQCCACLDDKGYCKLKQRGSPPPPATSAYLSSRLLCSQSLALRVTESGPTSDCVTKSCLPYLRIVVPRSPITSSSVLLSMSASAMCGHS